MHSHPIVHLAFNQDAILILYHREIYLQEDTPHFLDNYDLQLCFPRNCVAKFNGFHTWVHLIYFLLLFGLKRERYDCKIFFYS